MIARERLILSVLAAVAALTNICAQSPIPIPEGRVTVVFHDVQLWPAQADPRPAVVDDKVDEGTALRTGDDSRSELTFTDLTITRLGANTVFSFNKAGRSIHLDAGSILLYAPKNSGAAEITAKVVTVGITGTTIIFESAPAAYDRLIVLEGAARFSLNGYPNQSTVVHAGYLLNVNAGAKKLPKPGRVDLARILEMHPLIKDFPPLPSLDLILAVQNRNPKVHAQSATVGAAGQSGAGTYVPNPTGPPPPGPPISSGYPVAVPNPTPTVHHHQATPTPHPTAKPTPRHTGNQPKPTPMPKRKYPPLRPRPTATPRRVL